MENLVDIFVGVLGRFDAPSTSVYWGHLLGALAIAAIVYGVRTGRGRSIGGLWRFVAPREVWGNRSVAHDAVVFLVNTLLYSFLFFGPLQALSTAVATAVWQGLHDAIGPLASPWSGPAVIGLFTVALAVAADFAFFVAHLVQHKVPWLWCFHAVHHSAPVLTPLTVFRRHPVDVVVEGAVSGAILGLVHGVFAFGAGGVPHMLEIAGTNAILYVFLLAGFNLHHSHVWLSFGPLDRVFVSPAAHQIHHSQAPEHRDRNFGNMLSIWDGLCGTRVRPTASPQSLTFGIEDSSGYRSVLGLYLTPFVAVLKRVRGGSSRRSSSAEAR